MTQKPSSADQFLDLLLDALLERNAARRAQSFTSPAPQPPQAAAPSPEPPSVEPQPPVPRPSSAPRPSVPSREPARAAPPVLGTISRSIPNEGSGPSAASGGIREAPRLPTINMGKTLGRLLILIAVLAVLINIPVTRHGVSLARIMPESSALIIRDGLVLKGSGPEIYVLEDDKLRWISSLDAFEHLNLTWEDVHVVDDEFLTRFEKGRPIHVLLKCSDSPHIYRLENDQKRWIKDIDTFLAEGHVWDDVRIVSCDYLRDIPDGPPIPEDAGPPPQP
jgi:hypothetical protein